MRCVLTAGLAVILFAASIRAGDDPPGKAKSPAERYQALLQEYWAAIKVFSDAYHKADTAEAKSKVAKEKSPDQKAFGERFMTIADSAPDDPAAVDCLVWVIGNRAAGPKLNQIVDRLVARHAADRKVGAVAPSLVYAESPSAERLLRAIVEKNPDRESKGQACLALGQFLKRQAESVRELKQDSPQAKEIREGYKSLDLDEAVIAELARRDPDAVAREAEAMFERTAKEFADVSIGRSTLGKQAEGELNEIRNLGVGRPAPEIAGQDIDGKAFKLSDYKGKVVVVDFWGDW
jgi:hypothetical protein